MVASGKSQPRAEGVRTKKAVQTYTPELCDVIQVYPHRGRMDTDFFVCDCLLRDRKDPSHKTVRTRVIPAQRDHFMGLASGTIWQPRRGDLVLVYYYDANKALLLCNIPNWEQEPIVKPWKDYVRKREQHHEPKRCSGTAAANEFELPSHPDCHRFWDLTRDEAIVWDCSKGRKGVDPFCIGCPSTKEPVNTQCQGGCVAPGAGIDYICDDCTSIKVISDDTDSTKDVKGRFLFTHRSRGRFWFDDDCTIMMVNHKKGGTGPTSHMVFWADDFVEGAIELHSRNLDFATSGNIFSNFAPASEAVGARIILNPDGSVDIRNLASNTGHYIQLTADGNINIVAPNDINITAGNEINLTAPTVNIDCDVINCPGAAPPPE